ncbi:hypothetical protein WMY93_002514 [Mugilogobius chulae]|uniref:Uncharacterized protein n=1 Tax=Mugilogobius chulae TaxID=88201 RepID=A0AAW0PU35_9GOBI
MEETSTTSDFCTTKNMTCKEMQTSGGFKYPLEPGKQSPVTEIAMENKNGTPLARMQNENCVRVNYVHLEKDGNISENCQFINAIENIDENMPSSTGLDQHWNTIGIVAGFVVVALAFGALGYYLWRKLRKGKEEGATPCLINCLDREKWNPGAQLDQSNAQNTLNCQLEQLLDDKSGNRSMHTSINMEPDKTINNDPVPRVNGVFSQPGLNGNRGHDPGGGKDTELNCNGSLQHCEQQTLDGHRRSKDNGCILSRDQGSAREEAFDETTGEDGQALVDSPGPESKCNSPPQDVEKGTQYKEDNI